MTVDEIKDFYRGLGVENEQTVDFLAANTHYAYRPKGSRLRVAGEPMNSILFHLNGVGRVYVLDEKGREHIMGFCCHAPGPCLGAAGIQEKLSLNIDAATSMDTLELPISALQHALAHDPSLNQVLERLMREDHDKDYAWQIALKTNKGAGRYRWFLEEYADIADLVTQRDIASFLDLRPQSLSRIKNGLSDN